MITATIKKSKKYIYINLFDDSGSFQYEIKAPMNRYKNEHKIHFQKTFIYLAPIKQTKEYFESEYNDVLEKLKEKYGEKSDIVKIFASCKEDFLKSISYFME